MSLTRRNFLKITGFSLALSHCSPSAGAAGQKRDIYATAYMKENVFGVAILSQDGEILSTYSLPARGHDVVFSPTGSRCVVFARRPGNFALAFKPLGKELPQLFHSPSDRHFYGHGCFSTDERLLFATENDYENGLGKIGIYDVTNRFRRLGEFASYGVGPHDIMQHPDGVTLIVANGGIETHPDYGRAKLNISTMEPSLVFIDARSGSLIEKFHLSSDLHKVSLRHMDMDKKNDVWIGGQYQGTDRQGIPLVMHHTSNGDTIPVELPDEAIDSLNGYVGSVCVNDALNRIAVTSPKGGVLLSWDIDRPQDYHLDFIKGASGVAANSKAFSTTTDQGEWVTNTETEVPLYRHVEEMKFDNHLGAIPQT